MTLIKILQKTPTSSNNNEVEKAAPSNSVNNQTALSNSANNQTASSNLVNNQAAPAKSVNKSINSFFDDKTIQSVVLKKKKRFVPPYLAGNLLDKQNQNLMNSNLIHVQKEHLEFNLQIKVVHYSLVRMMIVSVHPMISVMKICAVCVVNGNRRS
jgi:hypothetical protein